jgi:hypothetical protein
MSSPKLTCIHQSVSDLTDWLQSHMMQESGETFLGLPERWMDARPPRMRCVNGHVSTRVLKSERLGRTACLACGAPVRLTFPEDTER